MKTIKDKILPKDLRFLDKYPVLKVKPSKEFSKAYEKKFNLVVKEIVISNDKRWDRYAKAWLKYQKERSK